jgi:hypothetical protein
VRARILIGVIAVCAATAVVVAQAPAPAQAAAAPFAKLKRPKFKPFVSPIGNFQVDYPDSRDWTVLSGVGEAVLMIVENKTGSAFATVERVQLRGGAFTPQEMPAAADREAATVKQRNPAAAGLRHQVMSADNRQVIVVQYARTGVRGPEQMVHYAIPIGETLYRVTCSIVEKEYARYAPICGHIAASVLPAATPVK